MFRWGKPYQSPGRMKNSSYYIALVGDRTHKLPHTVASNMVNGSHDLNHSAAVTGISVGWMVQTLPKSLVGDTGVVV